GGARVASIRSPETSGKSLAQGHFFVDRQVLLAVALSALVVIAYQEYLRIYYPDLGKKQAPASGATPEPMPATSDVARPEPLPPETGVAPKGDITVDTPLIHAAFSSMGGRLVSFKLKHYRTTINPESPPLELIAAGAAGDLPLGVVLRGAASWSDQRLAYVPSVPSLSLGPGQNGEIVLRGQSPEGLTLEKALRFDAASYAFTLALAVADSGHRYGEAGLQIGRAHV